MYGLQLRRLRLAIERAARAVDAASAVLAGLSARRAARRKRRHAYRRLTSSPPLDRAGPFLCAPLPSSMLLGDRNGPSLLAYEAPRLASAMSGRSSLVVAAPHGLGPLSPFASPTLAGCCHRGGCGGDALLRSLLSVRVVSAPLRRMLHPRLPLRSQDPGLRSLCGAPLALVADAAWSSPHPPLAPVPLPATGCSSPLFSPPRPSPLPARAPWGPAPVAARAGLPGPMGRGTCRGALALLCSAAAASCPVRVSVRPLRHARSRHPRWFRVPSWVRFQAPRMCRRSASP